MSAVASNTIHKICNNEEKLMILDIIIIASITVFNKELRMNYIPKIRNGCDVWEQAFCCYCVDPLVSSDAYRWGYM